MFLIRSAFWLGLALIVIQPQGWDLGAKADALSTAAVDAGKQVVVQQVMNTQCDSIECVGGKAMLLASGITHNPSQASTMQDSLGLKLAPVPRPRPAWAG